MADVAVLFSNNITYTRTFFFQEQLGFSETKHANNKPPIQTTLTDAAIFSQIWKRRAATQHRGIGTTPSYNTATVSVAEAFIGASLAFGTRFTYWFVSLDHLN
jgi:hypothetical protein